MVTKNTSAIDDAQCVAVTVPITDCCGQLLTVISITQPSNGSVTLTEQGLVLYTPNASYDGNDGFTCVTEDLSGVQTTYTVEIGVSHGRKTRTYSVKYAIAAELESSSDARDLHDVAGIPVGVVRDMQRVSKRFHPVWRRRTGLSRRVGGWSKPEQRMDREQSSHR